MAEKEVKVKVRLRTDSAVNWLNVNPVLLKGEIGVEEDTGRIKIGNGKSAWAVLPYFNSASSSVSGTPASVSRDEILNYAFPIGSIKMTATNENPGNTLGGVWERWGQGRFPLSVGDEEGLNESEIIGGEKEHALTIDEIPSHAHSLSLPIGEEVVSLKYNGQMNGINPEVTVKTTEESGGGMAHNNMPPFITCYFWKRTA